MLQMTNISEASIVIHSLASLKIKWCNYKFDVLLKPCGKPDVYCYSVYYCV